MRLLPLSGLTALSIVLAAPAIAQEAPDIAQNAGDPADGGEITDNEIVVIASKLPGSVDSPQPPVLELDEEDIASYGAGSLAELVEALSTETSSGRGRGSGPPVFLVNGRRVSSFREMRSYPPEAIRKVEVLSEEVSQQFGYSADQRVINFILKDNFSSKEIEVDFDVPFRGETSETELEATLLKIDGQKRLNLNFETSDTTPLTQAERGVVSTAPATVAGDPDPTDYRTLIGDSANYELTGNYSFPIGDSGTAATLNGTLERNNSRSLFGLDRVLLTDPSGDSELRYFNADDPLTRRSRTDTASFGSSVNGRAGDWQLTGTVDATYTNSRTLIDTQAETSALVAAAAAGNLAIDGPFDAPTEFGFDTARSKTYAWVSKFTAIGKPVLLPAGEVSVTLDTGFDWKRIESSDTRSNTDPYGLTRRRLDGGVNVSIPIASRRDDVWAAIGDVTATLGAGVEDLSDFGTLANWTAGLNWGITEKLNFQASYIVRDAAPSLTNLGAPTIVTANQEVYDFTTGQTALVDITSGGNPNLLKETQRDLKLGLSYDLPFFQRSDLRIEYFRNNSQNVTASFPLLTDAIEAAFPDRVTRGASGQLIAIDQRPVTFAQQKSQRLRIGLNLSGQIGKEPEDRGGESAGGAAPAGGPPPGAGGGGGAGQGRPGFDPSRFAAMREQFCAAEPGTTPDLSALPEQMRQRLLGEDGQPDPAKIAQARERFCSADGAQRPAFDPERFAALRRLMCPEGGGEPDYSKLPEEVLARFRNDAGELDMERLKVMRERVCSMDPQALAARQQGQTQGGDDARGSGEGARRGGRRGGGGPGFMGQRSNTGRWRLGLDYTLELSNKVTIADGGPVLDLLNGDALSGSGTPRHTVSLNGGAFYKGNGLRVDATYKSGTRVAGSGLPGSSDLYFGDLFTMDARLFIDLGSREKLVEKSPFFKNVRVSVGVDNIFDGFQRVTNDAGEVPLSYQPFLLDPNGRTLKLEFRKLF